MAKPKLSALEHLRLLALRSRAYFTSNLTEVSETVADAIDELDKNKANTTYVNEAIESVRVLTSSTEGSTKKFELIVDDTGRIGVKEVS